MLTEGRHPYAPSLDQIEPSKGYTPDNVRVVVWMFNAAKGAFTESDVMGFARAIIENENTPGY